MHAVADLLICLRFFSRLPVPATRREIALGGGGLAAAAAMVPVAGAIIGLIPAWTLVLAGLVGLPPILAALLAVATMVMTTGTLHEDGLADCADGFGGGGTRARKLEIMRDSRIGTYGTCAIVVSLGIRASALAAVAAHAPTLAAAAVVVAASLSRAVCLVPLWLLPAARSDGLGAGVGRPRGHTLATALILGVGAALVLVPLDAGAGQIATAILLAFAGAAGMSVLALRQIGGQTGDVAGATQQVAECVILCVLAAGA